MQIVCAIEDLKIEDVEYKGRKPTFFENLPGPKRLAVLQYIRDAISEHGIELPFGTDKFAKLVLADATPQIES